jgi:hypothetical protein
MHLVFFLLTWTVNAVHITDVVSERNGRLMRDWGSCRIDQVKINSNKNK